MKLLLDTHLLLWAAEDAKQLPKAAPTLIEDLGNDLARLVCGRLPSSERWDVKTFRLIPACCGAR